MTVIFRWVMSLLLVFLSGSEIFASTLTFSSLFLDDGKPIDARCLMTMDYTGSLKTCQAIADKYIIISGQDAHLKQEGFMGYRFKQKGSTHIQGYSYYRPIAQYNRNVVVYTVSNDGGSGEYTSIKTVSHQGSHIRIKTYDGGDRCNNGIVDVAQDKGQLTYRAHITPFDFLTLANDNPHQLKAYEDLVACAVCCAGTVLKSRPLNEGFSKATIQSVDFSHYVLDKGGYGKDKPYQQCFNSLIRSYQSRHLTTLTLPQLKVFVKELNKQCTPSKLQDGHFH